ncbi:MAG: IS1634 family transposase [Deltaproteobacteria bacterium]|nr:IS1634 family transposase [Deltaproteobacteria bacterium]
MITQKGIHQNTTHKKFVIGAHPIIQVFIETLKIPDIIGTYIKQDERLKLPIEQTLTVLIHNILTHPMPMYEIADWVAPLDEKSIGLDLSGREVIHDDRLGQALEIFYRGRHKDVFFRLALRAIKIFELSCSRIHQDTTTVTFSGKYAGWTAREFMTYGINKDHRPDLKQLVLGMSVTADGSVPLVHKIYDGNQSDDRLHPENHQRLRHLLQRSDFIYVADCKLAAEENLRKISSCGGRFVTVMPRTWEQDKNFRDHVRQEKIEWALILSRKNNRKPDSKVDRYYLAQGTYQAKGYPLLWIKSTQKAEQDAETRARHIEKALENLRALQVRLNTYHLKKRSDIQQKVREILKQGQCRNWIDVQIHSQRTYKKHYSQVGRPMANQPTQLTWVPSFSMTFQINHEKLREEILTDGVFPLIHNLGKEFKSGRILEIYKFQPFLEKRHSQLKTWQEITPVLLKKAERVVALLHMHVMALMVSTLIERKLRIAMKNNSINDLPLYPEGHPCPYPTLSDIVRLFRGVEKYEVEQGDDVVVFPAQLSKLQKQVLQLLEIPISLYQ